MSTWSFLHGEFETRDFKNEPLDIEQELEQEGFSKTPKQIYENPNLDLTVRIYQHKDGTEHYRFAAEISLGTIRELVYLGEFPDLLEFLIWMEALL